MNNPIIKQAYIVWAEFGSNEAAFDTLAEAKRFAEKYSSQVEILISLTDVVVFEITNADIEYCAQRCAELNIFDDDPVPIDYYDFAAFYSIGKFYSNIVYHNDPFDLSQNLDVSNQ